MGIVVNHEERQKEILQHALTLFGKHGYQDVTYRQIAEACGLSRTSLYKYFRNKREIFDNGLFQLMLDIGDELQQTLHLHPNLSVTDKLELVFLQALDVMLQKPDLLRTIFEYVLSQQRLSEPVAAKIRRHTAIFRRTLSSLLHEGLRRGELCGFDAIRVSDHLYALIESSALRIILSDVRDRDLLAVHGRAVIQAMRQKSQP